MWISPAGFGSLRVKWYELTEFISKEHFEKYWLTRNHLERENSLSL